MDEQITASVSHSGSDTDTDTDIAHFAVDHMSAQVTEAAPAVPAFKEEDVPVPHPAELDDAFGADPPDGEGDGDGDGEGDDEGHGLGALAHDEVDQTDETDAADEDRKRAGESVEDGPAKRPKLDVWGALLGQVRGELRSMSSDECFSRALELQMLARSEVGHRSQHLSHAMDLMATGAPVPDRPPAAPVKREGGRQSPLGGAPDPHRAPPVGAPAGPRVTKAEREVSKQKPIKTTKAAPVPCMKMTPPLPPRCEVDHAPDAELPAFCQLVNFPTARYYGNCVMCDEAEFSIPKQNKGVCNNCDVAIWVVNPSGMNIKWCKGCKNFRKWIDFGVKGYSSKCERCRCQQAARYANQKHKGPQPSQVAPLGPLGVPVVSLLPAAPVAVEPVVALEPEQLTL